MLVALAMTIRAASERNDAVSTLPTPLLRPEFQWGSITWAIHATRCTFVIRYRRIALLPHLEDQDPLGLALR